MKTEFETAGVSFAKTSRGFHAAKVSQQRLIMVAAQVERAEPVACAVPTLSIKAALLFW